MFKITPVQSKEEQIKLCHLCGADYREGAFAYVMFDIDSGDIMGMSQFEISEYGYIFDLREPDGHDDFEAMFILGRQTMNFIDTCGAHSCYADKAAGVERLLKAIGFKENGDKLFCDMTGMFDGHCSGHAVKLD
ncbi:MAG: hypothetical protein J6K85_00775 [Clostridia bacterium]|nr:hypothetical protein [Clostridia bacterium]